MNEFTYIETTPQRPLVSSARLIRPIAEENCRNVSITTPRNEEGRVSGDQRVTPSASYSSALPDLCCQRSVLLSDGLVVVQNPLQVGNSFVPVFRLNLWEVKDDHHLNERFLADQPNVFCGLSCIYITGETESLSNDLWN